MNMFGSSGEVSQCRSRSEILTSQLPVTRGHEQMGDPTVADGILDRLVHGGCRVITLIKVTEGGQAHSVILGKTSIMNRHNKENLNVRSISLLDLPTSVRSAQARCCQPARGNRVSSRYRCAGHRLSGHQQGPKTLASARGSDTYAHGYRLNLRPRTRLPFASSRIDHSGGTRVVEP